MLYLKNLKQIKSPDYNIVLKKVAILVSNRKMLFQFLNTDVQKQGEEIVFEKSISSTYQLKGKNENQNQNGDSLIDKFLLSKPGGLRRKNSEDIRPAIELTNEVLEKSTAENDEIITETLAMIYFQQKNYKKALVAYEKLSLKYPEKSVYFATRIEELEKLKNIN